MKNLKFNIMYKNIIFGILISLLACSCGDPFAVADVTLGIITPDCDNCAEENGYTVWQHEVEILSNYKWSRTFENPYNNSKDFKNIILQDDKVIFYDSGFEVLNQKSGQNIWSDIDGYEEYLQKSKLVNDSQYIYRSFQGNLKKININNGNVEEDIEWSTLYEGVLTSTIVIEKGVLFALIQGGSYPNNTYKWASCPTTKLSSNEWTFYNDMNINNIGNINEFTAPVFYTKPNGDKLIIYSMNGKNENNVNSYKVNAFNLNKEELEWTISKYGNSLEGSQLIKDDNNIIFNHAYTLFNVNAVDGSQNWVNSFYSNINIDDIESVGNYILIEDYDFNIHIFDKVTGQRKIKKSFNGSGSHFVIGYEEGTAQFYQDKVYYINSRGSLMTIDIDTGEHQRYHLPKRFSQPSFENSGMKISNEGIIYTSDGARLLAIEIPE